MANLHLLEANRKIYDQVIAKFDDYFKVRTNVILRFNRRNQFEGETAETYITYSTALLKAATTEISKKKCSETG